MAIVIGSIWAEGLPVNGRGELHKHNWEYTSVLMQLNKKNSPLTLSSQINRMQVQAFTNTKIKFWLIIKIISEVILFLKFWLESCAQVMVKEQDV